MFTYLWPIWRGAILHYYPIRTILLIHFGRDKKRRKEVIWAFFGLKVVWAFGVGKTLLWKAIFHLCCRMQSCPAFQRTVVVVGQHQTYLANSVGQVRTGGCFVAGHDSPSFITSQQYFKKGKYKCLNSSSVGENCARSIVPDVLSSTSTPHPSLCSVPWEADLCWLDHITQTPWPSRPWARWVDWQGRGEKEREVGVLFSQVPPYWAVFLRPQVSQVASLSQFSFLPGSKNSAFIHSSHLENGKDSLSPLPIPPAVVSDPAGSLALNSHHSSPLNFPQIPFQVCFSPALPPLRAHPPQDIKL